MQCVALAHLRTVGKGVLFSPHAHRQLHLSRWQHAIEVPHFHIADQRPVQLIVLGAAYHQRLAIRREGEVGRMLSSSFTAARNFPVAVSQKLIVRSCATVASTLPSGLKTMLCTESLNAP
jgi:hypothetical protein